MDSLTELYNQVIVPKDAELEKQAAEMIKQAEEEDAAGRIMARGFADELNKLAGAEDTLGITNKTVKMSPQGGSVKAAPFKVGGGNTGGGANFGQQRAAAGPPPSVPGVGNAIAKSKAPPMPKVKS